MINRTDTARALAKAIAFKDCGKHAEAAQWARQLIHLLECAEILESFDGAQSEIFNPATLQRN